MSDDLDGRDVLEELIEKFEAKTEKDEKLKEELQDFHRKILVEFESGERYNFTLKEAEVEAIEDGPLDDPDITLSTDVETLKGIMDGEVSAMKAYGSNKLNVDAPFTDLLKFKKLL